MTLPTLRRRMLWQVMVPLALTWLIGTITALALAVVFVGKAFDRSLLDDAYALSSSVELRDGLLGFGLTRDEVAAVLFDRDEQVFFAVLRPDGSLLAGHEGLRAGPLDGLPAWTFADVRAFGLELRQVTLARAEPQPHRVIVAQTTRSRTRLLLQLLVASMAPQAILLLLLSQWLRRSIDRQLRPLVELGEAIARRDPADLSPLQLEPQTLDIERLTAAFNVLIKRIAHSIQAMREFTGNVAHELRTPLAGIRSLAEYALSKDQPDARQRGLERILASEQRATHLVEQLLALALADETGPILELGPVRLDQLVREALLRLLPQAGAQGVDLGARGLEAPLWVNGHAALVEGILGNLVDNALRHGRPAGTGESASVTVELSQEGEEVTLAVTDNGPGMSEADRGAALARWARGTSSPSRGAGSGLGLAIVARYTALLGGIVALEPAPQPSGLRACVRLRAAAAPA